MLLIFLFFIMIFIAIISAKIRTNIENIELSNLDETGQKSKLKYRYNIKFEIYIFGCICVAKIKLDNTKIEKMEKAIKNMKYDISDISRDIKNRKELISILKCLKIKEMNFKLDIGTEEIMSTVGTIVFLSTIIAIIVGRFDGIPNKIKYQIMPIYNHGNIINLWFNSILDVYFVHIIYTLYIIIKERKVKKNVRRNIKSKTSNRRAYDYSNG